MIGIIGGAGPLASALLYQLIIEKSYQNKQTPPELLIFNHNFPRGLCIDESTKNHTQLEEELQASIHLLLQAGASKVCIACNTLHGFVQNSSTLPLIHLSKTVLKAVHRHHTTRIALLSTETTHALEVYQGKEFEFIPPSSEDQNVLNTIFDHILEGVILQKDSTKIEKIVQKMCEKQAIDSVILGCSDLSVLNHHYPIDAQDVHIFDSMDILAEEIVRQTGVNQ